MSTTLETLLQELHGPSSGDGGEFTTDMEAQARKLAHHGGTRPSLVAFQAIQAAVASAASEVVVHIDRDGFEVSFQPSVDFKFSPGQPSMGRAHKYLLNGLQSAFRVQAYQVELKVSERAWIWREGRLVAQDAGSQGCQVRIVWPKVSWWKRLLPSSLASQLHSELSERLRFCPIPIKVNGRLINSPYPEKIASARVKAITESYLWFAEHLQVSDAGPVFSLASPGCRIFARVKLGRDGEAQGLPLRDFLSLASKHPPVAALGWLEGALSQEKWELRRHFEVTPSDGYNTPQVTDVISTGKWESELPLSLTQDFYPVGKVAVPYAGAALCLPNMEACLTANLRMVIPTRDRRYKSRGTLPCLRLAGWLGMRARPVGQPSLLYYIQDGLLLDPVEVSSDYPGSVYLLAREEVEVDLSSLNPIRNASLDGDLRQMRQLEQRLVREGRAQMDGKDSADLKIPGAMRKVWKM